MKLTMEQLQALRAAAAAFQQMTDAFSDEQFETLTDTLDPNAGDSLQQMADAFASVVQQHTEVGLYGPTPIYAPILIKQDDQGRAIAVNQLVNIK